MTVARVAPALGRRLDPVRWAPWLTPARARAWLRVLAATLAALVVGWVVLSRDGVDIGGNPLGTDFVSFWTASRLALSGGYAAVYDPATHAAAEAALFPGSTNYYAFFYPPVFLLVCAPLALLPYMAALVVWLGAGLLALWASIRRLLPRDWGCLPLLAFPAVLVNASHGQNGFLAAACFGGYAALLARRPFMAGLCLGALVFKPHLLVAAPVVLLAGRRWAAIAGAAVMASGLVAASVLVFGRATWSGFLAVAPLARATLEQGLVLPAKMQSVFAAILVLHGPVVLGYAAQALVAGAVFVVLAWVARQSVLRRAVRPRAEAALLVCAVPLCTPFLLDYDLVMLAIPLAWLASEAVGTGWLAWEKIVALAAYVVPFVGRPVAMVGVPLAPVVMMLLLLVVARRACVGVGTGRGWRASDERGGYGQDERRLHPPQLPA